MTRLFVAIDLPDETRAELEALCNGLPGARWVRDGQFHLTLRFIGEVDGPLKRRIEEVLHGVRADPFELALSGVGRFPPRGEAQVLWAGVADEQEVLALHDEVERVLRRAGLPPEERKFAPHLTLARLSGTPPGRLLEWMRLNAGLAPEPVPVSSFELYASRLSAQGSQHVLQAAYPLFVARA